MLEHRSPVEVVYVYTYIDQHWLKQLDTHLNLFERQRLISIWSDRQIQAGTNREQDIDTCLRYVTCYPSPQVNASSIMPITKALTELIRS
jgi:hypothetical protein